MHSVPRGIARRQFLASAAAGSAGLLWAPWRSQAAGSEPTLLAGEGVVDTTPPLGIEMGGFHRSPGKERRIVAIRQSTAARALVLQMGDTQAAIISLDMVTHSSEMAQRVQQEVARQTGIPAENVRVCATHTHSMPAFCYFRQWGAIPAEYMQEVEKKCVQAVVLAKEDLAPAKVSLGKSRAVHANFNRTTNDFKTDEQFTKDSTDDERWLDTTMHVLLFERAGGKRSLLWYHFSAHAVCYADEQAGPDWPGEVAELVKKKYSLQPSFLQGHIGDVNPGNGTPWRGEVGNTVAPVFDAFCRAMDALTPIQVDRLRSITRPFQVPLDLALRTSWLEEYRQDPSKCNNGRWVDASFAEDWYRGNVDRKVDQASWPITLSAMRLGPIGLAFHPSELYSYYGLAMRRGSPMADTLVVGYADGYIGYLTDPKAYQAGEYSALVVPKISDIPPYQPTAARQMTAAVIELLKEVAA
jgi:hypothetical protein